MSNHAHYLLEADMPQELSRIMHWINWYTAMCLNRLLKQSGHLWEKKYQSAGFPETDFWRSLANIRYIQGNLMTTGEAKLQKFYPRTAITESTPDKIQMTNLPFRRHLFSMSEDPRCPRNKITAVLP